MDAEETGDHEKLEEEPQWVDGGERDSYIMLLCIVDATKVEEALSSTELSLGFQVYTTNTKKGR